MMDDEPLRPDPDALLTMIAAEEKQSTRGKLKIFFGSSAGVGKTYAMLSAAHEAQNEGTDVAVGVVETHKRPETEKLLEGLPVIAPLLSTYRGMELSEVDLDAVKARKPKIVLIDELAHTNAPGSRHPKRWMDVMEILSYGIDVYTTLNVQHIESLADLVAGATGVWVKETVPDSVFDEADDIMLVDIDADDLLKRLQEGKVYVAAQVKAKAAESFFRKANLIALRELALRRTAERVDAQMDAYHDTAGTTARMGLSEKILVCIGPGPTSAKLIRTAKRMSSSMKAPWVALCVESVKTQPFDDAMRHSVESLCRMVERMGGKAVMLQADSVVDEILAYAKQYHFTKILVGKSVGSVWRERFHLSLADHIIHKSGSIDVYVVTADQVPKPEAISSALRAGKKIAMGDVTASLFLLALTTGFGLSLRSVVTQTDQALFFIMSIFFIAIKRGLVASVLSSLLAAISFNFFFIPPYYSFSVEHHTYVLTFMVMLLTGYFVAVQTSWLRLSTLAARRKQKQTEAFFRLTRELTSTRGRTRVSEVVVRAIDDMLGLTATIWLPTGAEGNPASVAGSLPEDGFMKELGVLQWCYDNGQIAGTTTNTMPSARGLYLPLLSNSGTLGVLGVYVQDEGRALTLDEITSLEMTAGLLATALERVKTGEAAEQARVKAENEKLLQELERARNAILQAQQGNIAPCLEIYKPIVE